MPIISQVGGRSLKVRMTYGALFLILILGGVSMIYPMMLMVSGSVQSQVDYPRLSVLPEFLWNDSLLWGKYIQSKYGVMEYADRFLKSSLGDWRNIKPLDHVDPNAEAFIEYRDSTPWPREWALPGHWESSKVIAKNGRRYRDMLRQAAGDDIQSVNEATGLFYADWTSVNLPSARFWSRRFNFPQTVDYKVLYELTATAPHADWVIVDPDGVFLYDYLRPQWGDVQSYNQAHGTQYEKYDQVLLATHPPENPSERTDWEKFVRNELNIAFIRINPAATGGWREFLRQRYSGKIQNLNREWKSQWPGFDAISLPEGLPRENAIQSDLGAFVKDAANCPLDALSIYGPRQGFEQYVAKQKNVEVSQVAPLPIPTESVDYLDFQKNKGSLRWEFVKRNYIAVMDYLLVHGNGIRNTVIFCFLMVMTNLLVNPLAAYALSRYRPPSTYTILLFCMATMAFPAEVTMIPSFLLLKRFPLYGLLVGTVATLLVGWLLSRWRPNWPSLLSGMVAVVVGIAAGWWLTPLVAQEIFGREHGTISLLNTFWALVLPGMANGYSIFLLKGFFDSLPKELYEASDIDGASEWTKFWMITMSLSKPILAVLALAAFTTAYSEFMMALVIIPDQDMWTIMVWLFQLQSRSHPTLVYASLVIAAIPTLIIFLFCQNLIIRGIVVPSEK
jgi:multiple sugar transport system permease protein